MPLGPKPRVSKKTHLFTQLTYDLPHRVHCSKFYPISPHPISASKTTPAPSVIVYGHDQGITVVWTGFKSIKRETTAQENEEEPQAPRSKGASRKRTSAADDEEPNLSRRLRRRRREVVETEPDGDVRMLNDIPPPPDASSQTTKPPDPFDSADESHAQTVHLGTAVYNLAFVPSTILPPITSTCPPLSSQSGVDQEPAPLSTMLLKNDLVIAVACADKSVRLITVPLYPTVPEVSQVLTLSGISGHRSMPTTISLTVVPSPVPIKSPLRFAHRPSSSHTAAGAASTYSGPQYDFLIASASPDVSGLLLLWRINLTQATPSSPIILNKPQAPRSHYLSYAANHLSFNPSSSSSLSRHHLLVTDTAGSLRILDTEKGRWLLSLYMDYPAHSSTAVGSGNLRKRILGAEWCLNGLGIVTLDGDGEWGVFELAGKGKYLSLGIVGEKLDGSGGSGKRFGAGSTVFGGGSDTASSSTGCGANPPRMISSTRSIKSTALSTLSNRSWQSQSPATSQVRGRITKGSLAVTILPTTTSRTNLFTDITPKRVFGETDHEMLLLVYENQVLLIPSIQETLSAKKKGGDEGGEKGRRVELKDVVLGGEDVECASIRWVIATRPEGAGTEPAPVKRNGLGNGVNEDDDAASGGNDSNMSDSELYINDQGDVVVTNGSTGGNSGGRVWDKFMPEVRVALGAGARLNILCVEEEVLSLSVSAREAVAARALGSGSGIDVGGAAREWFGGGSTASVVSGTSGMSGVSGTGKRKLGVF